MYAIRDVVLSPSYSPPPDIPIPMLSIIVTKIPNETPAPALSDPSANSKLPRHGRFDRFDRFGGLDPSDPSVNSKLPRHDRFDRFNRFPAGKSNPRSYAEPAGESEEIVDDWEMPEEDTADFDLSVGSTVSPFRREPSNETARSPRICSRPRAMRRFPRERTRAFRARRSSGNC